MGLFRTLTLLCKGVKAEIRPFQDAQFLQAGRKGGAKKVAIVKIGKFW